MDIEVVKNKEFLKEYNELMFVVREVVPKDKVMEMCLNNPTLREKAGYEGNQTKYNPYIREFMDKLVYDEHNLKVEAAKKKNDKEELQRLSDYIMGLAGYKGANVIDINRFAKIFVDRTLLDKEYNRLYRAKKSNNQQAMDDCYRRIFEMSSYGTNQPYGVVNDCAQAFVDARQERYIAKGYNIPGAQENVRYSL